LNCLSRSCQMVMLFLTPAPWVIALAVASWLAAWTHFSYLTVIFLLMLRRMVSSKHFCYASKLEAHLGYQIG
jgi:hypothetical protein